MTIKRRGVFVGGYMPVECKQFLERRAKINFSTVSKELQNILSTEMDNGSAKHKDIQILKKRVRILETRVSRMTGRESFYHEINEELSAMKRILEFVNKSVK